MSGLDLHSSSSRRPTASKNKTKPPIMITRQSTNSFRAHIFEISSGCDIFQSLTNYTLRRQSAISILTGSGTVTNVNLRQPGDAVLALNGRFQILSLSGSFLPAPAPAEATCLSVFLAGGQGEVVGGSVVGGLIARGPVIVISASFTNVAYERLPVQEEEEALPLKEGGGFVDRDGMGLRFFELPLGVQSLPFSSGG